MNDDKLIRKCKKGNREAFNELISKYYSYVYNFMIKLTNDRDITLDLVQDTFMKFIKSIDSYSFEKNALFGTYIISIAKNTYIDYLRKNKNELQELDIENYMEIKNTSLLNEDYNSLLEKIEELPFLQKEVIKLKYIEGYTLNEIALMQKVSPKTIKSRLFEARKKLKEKMKGVYDE